MKLKNCMIGTTVQSKTTGLTGVVVDVEDDGFDKAVVVDFNVYNGAIRNKTESVFAEGTRKVKSINKLGHKERVCIVVKNSGVDVRLAVSYLSKLGYNKLTLSEWSSAEVLYGEAYGEVQCSGCLDWHYKHEAHLYRDITNEVGGK